MFEFMKKKPVLDVNEMLEEERAKKAECYAIINESPILKLLLSKFSVQAGLYGILSTLYDDAYHIIAKALEIVSEKLKNFEPANELFKLDSKITCIRVKASELEETVRNEIKEYVLNTPVEKISDEWITNKNKELEDALKQADEKVKFVIEIMNNIVAEKISPIVADAVRTAYAS
jgi:hypothetical protein